MSHRDDIVSFAEKLLKNSEVEDAWCENGLQVEGKEDVRRIALGVSSSASFLNEAAKWSADMCLVHHGLFWKKGATKVTGIMKKRLEVLLKNNISLVNFHIPLDAHEEIGNNAAIIELLELQNPEVVSCGFVAELKKEMLFAEFVEQVKKAIGQVNFAENFSLKPVKKVAVISGGAASFAPSVLKTGADTFLFGELSEHDYHDLKDMELSFIAAGHFATERYGVQRLGERIAKKFPDVEVQFFDEDCPV